MNALAVPGSPQPAVIDLGQVVDAIMIGDGGKVQFNNLTLQNAAPRNVPHTDTHARYKIRTFRPLAFHHNSPECHGEPGITVMLRASCISNVTMIVLSLLPDLGIECRQASF